MRHFLSRLLGSFQESRKCRPSGPRPRRVQLRFEGLEDRQMMARFGPAPVPPNVTMFKGGDNNLVVMWDQVGYSDKDGDHIALSYWLHGRVTRPDDPAFGPYHLSTTVGMPAPGKTATVCVTAFTCYQGGNYITSAFASYTAPLKPPPPPHITTMVWTGAGDGIRMDDFMNWDTKNQAPSDGDRLVFPELGRPTTVYRTGTATTLSSLDIQGSNYCFLPYPGDSRPLVLTAGLNVTGQNTRYAISTTFGAPAAKTAYMAQAAAPLGSPAPTINLNGGELELSTKIKSDGILTIKGSGTLDLDSPKLLKAKELIFDGCTLKIEGRAAVTDKPVTLKGNVTIDAGPGLVFESKVTTESGAKLNLTGPVIFSKDVTAKGPKGLRLTGAAQVFMERKISGSIELANLKEAKLYGELEYGAKVTVAKDSVASMELVNPVETRVLKGNGEIHVLGGTLKTGLGHPEYHGKVLVGKGVVEISGTPDQALGDGELTLNKAALKVMGKAGEVLTLPNSVKLGVSPTIISDVGGVGVLFTGDVSVPDDSPADCTLTFKITSPTGEGRMTFGADHKLSVAVGHKLTITGENEFLALRGSVSGHVVVNGRGLQAWLYAKLETGALVELSGDSVGWAFKRLSGTGNITLSGEALLAAREGLSNYAGTITVDSGAATIDPEAGLGSKSKLVMKSGTIRGGEIVLDGGVVFEGLFSIAASEVTFTQAIMLNGASMAQLWTPDSRNTCLVNLRHGVRGDGLVTFQDDRDPATVKASQIRLYGSPTKQVEVKGNAQLLTG